MIVGIDIGATKTLVAYYKDNGDIKKSFKFNTPHELKSFLSKLTATITQIEASANQKATILSIAAPGIKSPDSSSKYAEFGNFDWQNLDFESLLKRDNETKIVTDNDANVAALFEARKGAGKKYRRVAYITISTGIGTGFVENGQIVDFLSRSEGGHMLFGDIENQDLNIWEKFVSGKALVDNYGKLASEIKDSDIWETFSFGLAAGLHNLSALIQPEVIIIGGGVGSQGSKFIDKLMGHLKQVGSKMVFIPDILIASEPEEAVIRGCFELAKDAN